MLVSTILFLACTNFFIQPSLSKDIGNLLRLDGEHSNLLEKLKQRVYPKIKEEFMKHDWYVYQYLKENNWNLDKAELGMLTYINWREENNMQNIDKEDLSDFEKKYPYKVDGVDRFGRPILLIDFDNWDLMDIFSSPENKKRFFRYFNRIFDEATRKVMAMQEAGKNVTKFLLLADLEKVAMSTHVNVRTSAYYWEAANMMEKHFPGMFNNIVLINTPGIWQTLMPLLRYIYSEETNKGFKDYGGEDDWKPVLDNMIDPNELPPKYGGTKGLNPTKEEVLVDTFWKQKDGHWVWGMGKFVG